MSPRPFLRALWEPEKLVQEPIGPPGDDRGERAFRSNVAAPHVRLKAQTRGGFPPEGAEAGDTLPGGPPWPRSSARRWCRRMVGAVRLDGRGRRMGPARDEP